jgi:curved DNA-binding protein CbpA
MKISRLIAPLLLLDNVIVVVHAQHQRSRQERRRQRQERQQRNNNENNNSEEERNSNANANSNESYEYMKEKLGGLFRGDNNDQIKHYGPRHILEGLINTVIVSGSAAVAGAVSFVGLPLMFLVFAPGVESPSKGERVAGLIGGGIVGGILATGFWIGGLVFGLWQLIGGIIATPITVWAWLQGKVYWKDNAWQYYNLNQHAEELSATGGGRLLGQVQDDSLYQILGVETTASAKEIKRAYYKLAKEYHPDKNPDAEELFLKLHSAYETLHDEDKRKTYDEWGRSSDDPQLFDPAVFFDVVFGFSPDLEPYIGDLAIKSFSSNLLQLILSAQAMQQEGKADTVIQDSFQAFFVLGSQRRDQRQVDIALHLQEFSAAFVEGKETVEEFRKKSQEEAGKVMESTPFPVFVSSIGTSLYWEGRGSFHGPLDVPTSMMAWTRDQVHTVKNWSWFGRGIVQLVQDVRVKLVEAEEAIRQEHPRADEETMQKMKANKAAELLIPSLMEFVWKYNQRDIAKTLKGSCWKLLHSKTYETGKQRQRQAQALKILGQEFIRQTKEQEQVCHLNTCINESSSSSPEVLTDQARIEVALQMATSREKSSDVTKQSEDLIQQHKKKKEEEELRKERRKVQSEARKRARAAN